MSVKPCARSPHFMVHFLPGGASGAELSTGVVPGGDDPVDDFVDSPCGSWRLGLVVPKRHARRAVTRNAVKRQLRAAVSLRLLGLPPGDWVVRLRAPIPKKDFPSARSETLLNLLRGEINAVLDDAQRRALRGVARAVP